ncbi:uncharacterized protein LOC100208465 isoform X3 [Hydra vulgaris]
MMQHKYNMALQHFYQAAVTNNSNNNEVSDFSEEELFTDYQGEEFEIYNSQNKNSTQRDKPYGSPKKQIIQPKPILSCRSCIFLLIFFIVLFTLVCSITYFLQLGISRMVPVTDQKVIYQMSTVQKGTNLSQVNEIKNIALPNLRSCSGFKITKVWQKDFQKLFTDSSTRLVDINKDGVDDIIMGFGTSLDSYNVDQAETCSTFYNNKYPCFGGVLSADGVTGDQLWIHYSHHSILSINCNADFDADGVADCLCSGRGGVFEAISGATGKLLWIFLDKKFRSKHGTLYMPQIIDDINNDQVADVVQIQGGDFHVISYNKTRQPSKILFFCGKTGIILKAITIPRNEESNFSPILYSTKEELRMVYGTGSENQGGHLYVIPLLDLLNDDLSKLKEVVKDSRKGFINPPILADINKDGVVDLISAGLNQNVVAINGETLEIIWIYKMTGAETYSLPGVGFFNDDDIVDFVLRKNLGSFPVYYSSNVLILNGKTGEEILSSYKTYSVVHSSPLSVSMEGYGNDLLLYWSSECHHYNINEEHFQIVNGTDIQIAYNMDSCKSRFNSSTITKLNLMDSETGFPGHELYYSNSSINNILKKSVIQTMFQNGVIAQSLSSKRKQSSKSFDVVFAVNNIQPSLVRIIRNKDLACIDDLRKKAKKGNFDNVVDIKSNKAKGIYDRGDTAVNVCLQSRYNGTLFDDFKSMQAKNFNKGTMTLYRYQVTCACEIGMKCAKVLPQHKQGWTGYMGSMGNGYFNNRKNVYINK